MGFWSNSIAGSSGNELIVELIRHQYLSTYNSVSSGGYSCFDSSGNIYLSTTEKYWATPYQNQGVIAKFDKNGVVQWERVLYVTDGSTPSTNILGKIICDSSGMIYQVGTTYLPNQGAANYTYMYVAGYNNTGVMIWSYAVGGTFKTGNLGNPSNSGENISFDNNQNICVVGNTTSDIWVENAPVGNNPTRGSFVILSKRNSSGTKLWGRQFGIPNSAQNYGPYGYGIASDSSGNFYITGRHSDSTSNYAILIKYDSAGNLIWQKGISISGTSGFRGNNITTDINGNIYVIGDTLSTNQSEIWIGKFDNNGNSIWHKSFGGTNSDTGKAICCDSSGNIYITGYSDATTGSVIAQLDTNGNLIWQRLIQSYGLDISVDDVNGCIYQAGIEMKTEGGNQSAYSARLSISSPLYGSYGPYNNWGYNSSTLTLNTITPDVFNTTYSSFDAIIADRAGTGSLLTINPNQYGMVSSGLDTRTIQLK